MYMYITTNSLRAVTHESKFVTLNCDLSETSLEFTSGLEFEFVIVISIRDSNLLTHVLKIC